MAVAEIVWQNYIQRNIHLAPMKVCDQKFPIMQCFRFTGILDIASQTVVLYRGFILCTRSSFGGAFAKWRKTTVSFVKSVRLSVPPLGTTRLSLDGLLWNFIFEFSKILSTSHSSKLVSQSPVLIISYTLSPCLPSCNYSPSKFHMYPLSLPL